MVKEEIKEEVLEEEMTKSYDSGNNTTDTDAG